MCVADKSCPSVRELVDLLLLFKFIVRYYCWHAMIDSRNALQIFVEKLEAARVLLPRAGGTPYKVSPSNTSLDMTACDK